VWVILRADLFQGRDVEPKSLVTATAVVRSEEFARAEVDRLNALRPDGRMVYWCQVSRLVESATDISEN
jgi:hypothetical protein